MFAIHVLVEAGAVTLVTNRVVQLCISPRRLQLGEYPETLQKLWSYPHLWCGLIRICVVRLIAVTLDPISRCQGSGPTQQTSRRCHGSENRLFSVDRGHLAFDAIHCVRVQMTCAILKRTQFQNMVQYKKASCWILRRALPLQSCVHVEQDLPLPVYNQD